jgi:hypothetical protein
LRYEVINTNTVSVTSATSGEIAFLIVVVKFTDDTGFEHTKTFEFPNTITDTEVENQIIATGKELMNQTGWNFSRAGVIT